MERSVEADMHTKCADASEKKGSIVGIDQDAAAIEAASARLKRLRGEGYNSPEQLL